MYEVIRTICPLIGARDRVCEFRGTRFLTESNGFPELRDLGVAKIQKTAPLVHRLRVAVTACGVHGLRNEPDDHAELDAFLVSRWQARLIPRRTSFNASRRSAGSAPRHSVTVDAGMGGLLCGLLPEPLQRPGAFEGVTSIFLTLRHTRTL